MVYYGENQLDDVCKELMFVVIELWGLGAIGEVGEAFVILGMVVRSDGDMDGMRYYVSAVEDQIKEFGVEKHLVWVHFF